MFKIIIVVLAIWLLRAQVKDMKVSTDLPILDIKFNEAQTVFESANVMETYQYSRRITQYQQIEHESCKLQQEKLQIAADYQINGAQPHKNQKILYSEKYGIAYRLNQQEIFAYKMSSVSEQLIFIGRHQLTNSSCSKQGLFTHDEEYLFIFQCTQILRITVKTTLIQLKVTKLGYIFSGFKVINADGVILWLSAQEGIKMLSYTPSSELEQKKQIDEWQITDGSYYNGNLYLLAQKKYLYILEKQGSESFNLKTKISLEEIVGLANNFKIEIWESLIYIYSIEDGEQYITQLLLKDDVCYLVRYYKGFHNLVNFQIVNKRLMIATEKSLDFYEINQDPRKTLTSYSSISYHHITEMVWFQQIYYDKYFQVSDSSIHLLTLKLIPNTLKCLFKSSGLKQIQITENCKDIGYRPFYQMCFDKTLIKIQVVDPKSLTHLYAIISVFLFCLAVILFMIAWRKGKLQIIQKLINQINLLAGQNHQSIEFVEESASKQTDWNDIKAIAEGDFHVDEGKIEEGENQGVVETERHMT